MTLTVSQMVASSYNAVRAEARKATNQWAESALMRELERQGMVVRIDFGVQIEAPLDYQRNPGAQFLATPLTPLSSNETEVVTSAVYDFAELGVPVVWTKRTEGANPTSNQKIDLVQQLLTNGFDSHDDMVEQYIWQTSTNGFLGFLTHIPDNGQSSDGGIDSTGETMWRSQNSTYVDDTDINSAFTSVWNSCTKGSGSALSPTLMTSDSTQQALFEGTQTPQQRWVDTQELKAGFKVLGFKTSRYVFSKFGSSSRVYFLNPKSFQLLVSKQFYREKGETQEMTQSGQAGYRFNIYSQMQTITNNRSRLGVAHT